MEIEIEVLTDYAWRNGEFALISMDRDGRVADSRLEHPDWQHPPRVVTSRFRDRDVIGPRGRGLIRFPIRMRDDAPRGQPVRYYFAVRAPDGRLCGLGMQFELMACSPQVTVDPDGGRRGTTFRQVGRCLPHGARAVLIPTTPDGRDYPPEQRRWFTVEGDGTAHNTWFSGATEQIGRFCARFEVPDMGLSTPRRCFELTRPTLEVRRVGDLYRARGCGYQPGQRPLIEVEGRGEPEHVPESARINDREVCFQHDYRGAELGGPGSRRIRGRDEWNPHLTSAWTLVDLR